VKSQGQSIQYHGQISKDHGSLLYSFFVDYIRAAIFELQCRHNSEQDTEPLPDWFVTWKLQRLNLATLQSQQPEPSARQFDPSIPPNKLFADDPTYRSLDPATGMPLTTNDGQPLTKSATKKLRKVLDGQAKRHDKWARANLTSSNGSSTIVATLSSPVAASTDSCIQKAKEQTGPTSTATIQNAPDCIDWDGILEPQFCRVLAGTFGKRQGLKLESDMGPFCHVLRV
jgi:hypothetical protein